MTAEPRSFRGAVRPFTALWFLFSVENFLLVYSQEGDGCGHTVLSAKSGTIGSRNFPGTYPNNTQCVWNLKVPAEHTLRLTFGDFDLERSQDCRDGSLTITDKSRANILGPLCGQLAASDRNVVVNSSEVTVHFMSGIHRSGRGFLLSYSTNQHPDLVSCLRKGSHFSSKHISVFCPGGCKDVAEQIWGQHGQGYRDTSVLCKAAVHAGVISDSQGGMINVTLQRGITLYESSFANGVLSKIGSLSDKRLVFSKACDSPLAVMSYNASSMLEDSDWTPGDEDSGDHIVQWSSRMYDQQPWIELELWNRSSITGIITKGLPKSYVETYSLKFSKDRKTWKTYRDTSSKNKKVFEASTEGHTEALNSLLPPVTARYIQLWPQRWHGRVSAQVQVLGCPSAVVRPRSNTDGSTRLKPVPTVSDLPNPFSTQNPVLISPTSSSHAVILVVGVILGAVLCVCCVLMVLLWRRRKRAVHMNKCRDDADCQGFQGKKLPYSDSELVSYPLARSIHDSLPSPPLNVYAEPDVIAGGQKVGLTFRPLQDEGYTIPFSVNHYDVPVQVPEYAEPLRPEPEYATPFNDPSSTEETFLSSSRLHTVPGLLQYDCPAHRGLSNGYCTPLNNTTGMRTQPRPELPQHTYHEPL